ncbi:MAG: hypothetical protein HC929_00690 [Leptolyngbyaceae cyanobacterium SM2_5_2]|nr:hypothetical protein [Leptolyngbyaceae cyanobacterium SM2_5_2]
MATTNSIKVLPYKCQPNRLTETEISQEDNPMIISDLNYLQTVDANVEGGYYFGPSSKTIVVADIKENLKINKEFYGKTVVKGNFAGAQANADAVGKNTSTQAITETFVLQGKASSSVATSVSATSGYSYKY